MSKGYLILAQNNSKNDYVRMAYVTAMSIKLTQSEVKDVTLVTDVPEAVPHHYADAFDKILPIIWYDDALNSEWKIENRWKLYHLSPYQETIILDSDMLFLSDVSHWWNYLSKNHDIFITDKVRTYRNELVVNDYYRKAFTGNDLPNTYSAFSYFKKSPDAELFWKTVEMVVKNWEEFYLKYLKTNRPMHLSIDVAFAIAVKLLGFEDKVFSTLEYPTFTHMKGQIQNWKSPSENWMNLVAIYLNDKCRLKIGSYQQEGIFHYTEKEFLNDNLFYKYQNMFDEIKNG
jgi:hypothetical protein